MVMLRVLHYGFNLTWMCLPVKNAVQERTPLHSDNSKSGLTTCRVQLYTSVAFSYCRSVNISRHFHSTSLPTIPGVREGFSAVMYCLWHNCIVLIYDIYMAADQLNQLHQDEKSLDALNFIGYILENISSSHYIKYTLLVFASVLILHGTDSERSSGILVRADVTGSQSCCTRVPPRSKAAPWDWDQETVEPSELTATFKKPLLRWSELNDMVCYPAGSSMMDPCLQILTLPSVLQGEFQTNLPVSKFGEPSWQERQLLWSSTAVAHLPQGL